MLSLSAYLQAASAAPSASLDAAGSANRSESGAAAWFNEAVNEGGRVLHAPTAAASPFDAGQLTQRFMACLCDGSS